MIAVDPRLTTFGLALRARAEAGEKITFTTFAAGSGQVNSTSEADALVALKTVNKLFPINSIVREGQRVRFKGVIRSSDITSEFVFRELGLYAKGETGEAQLYWYVNYGESAGTMKASGSTVQTEQEVNVVTAISTAANVSITIQSAVWAEKRDLDTLTERVGTVETNKLEEAKYTVTIPHTGWTGSAAPFTKNVTLSGILATDEPIIDLVQSGNWSTDLARRDAWNCITRIVTANNQLKITADAIPDVDLPIKVRCFRRG